MSPSSMASKATPQGAVSSKLLIGLPEGTPRIKYTTMKSLKSVVDNQARKSYEDHSQSPFLVVESVPSTFLKTFDKLYLDHGPHLTANPSERIVILETMVYLAHGILTENILKAIRDKLESMSIRDEVTTTTAFRVTTRKFVKECDGGVVRLHQHPNDMQWPTLAVEVGLSESKNKLAIDAQGWLEAEGSRTCVVITAKLERDTPRITFGRWELDFPPFRPITRNYQPIGSIKQEVIATHEGGVTRVSGDMTIPFEKICGRPRQGPMEADIIIGRAAFKEISERSWDIQGFM
ncbi:hypothetical protein MGYG_05850 [Nannizzia gypsea CBS 118893]|uniref:Uncharacterized protein n=1 Tax=Arthroderma gypseum (strain ATCC MYA-4604 / CBS 118893) TaxID=535722 RepID=E4UZR2_ARTGP|nr:hypothetical protein MGYG_05850 [Nannizzia gypsea CBS 118893]EFR02849.1 hypothetical protein MGYG_05850 [Nannizzia gypsea CBS 118893]